MEEKKDYQSKILTIPNVLSLFRLCLIPVIIWFYQVRGDYHLAMITLIISGLSDIADGIIARRFNMVSDLGKMLDPTADKITQLVVLFCLLTRFPNMIVPIILLMVKELCAMITGIAVIRKTNEVFSSEWHGKATTVSLYTMMFIHLVWFNIPAETSDMMIGICVGIMMMSFAIYSIRNIRIIRKKNTGNS